MKKVLAVLLPVVFTVAAVTGFRAATVFEDRQPDAAPGISEIDFNHLGALQRFSGALKIPTVSHDDRSNFDEEAFLGFQDFLRTAYPLVNARAERTVVNDYSVVYRLNGPDPPLHPVLFTSHMDVVPVEDSTLDAWTWPPFSGTVADGMVWGRGSVDDKIGVISLMEALEMPLQENFAPQRSIYFTYGHDEEVSGREGAAKIAEYFADQGLHFDFVLDEGGAVTEGMITATDRPVAIIGVSEKGYVNLRLTVNADGGHSSQPPPHSALGGLASAVVNFRILPGATAESVKQRIIAIIDDERVAVTDEYGSDPPPVSPVDTRGYELIAGTIRAFDGNVLVAPYMVGGGTDARYYYGLSPNVYRFLMINVDPATMKYVHGIDEHVPVQDYLQAIRFYYHLVRQAGSA